MTPFARSTITGCIIGVTGLGGAVHADERVYVPQATTVSGLIHVRQALQLPDRRAERQAVARAQAVQSARAPKQIASDAKMLELKAVNAPSLPAAHIDVQ